METHKPLTKDENGEDVYVYLYRSMIESLMYLTSSRPDIMFSVCACSRFQVQTKVSHFHAVKRIFRYLKGQPKLGLWYPNDSPLRLEAFSDSDYAGASLDRKSTIGGCQFLGSRLISWQCKKQIVMIDYGYNFMQTKIHVDNESAICVIKNLVYHSKKKHIKIRHHFIRDSYEKRLIEKVKIHTDNNVADLLTKAFDVSRFDFLAASIVKNGLKKHVSSNCKDRHLGKFKRGQDTKVVVPGAKISYWGCRVNTAMLQVSTVRPKLVLVEFCDKHNIVAYLEKSEGSEGFHQIIDFLFASHIKYALTENPTIYASLIEQFWKTAALSTIKDGFMAITATIDKNVKVLITEASIRRHLKLGDFEGLSTLPTEEIFQ
nr:hypothetical protein [Tanacetum cinerariifolium]